MCRKAQWDPVLPVTSDKTKRRKVAPIYLRSQSMGTLLCNVPYSVMKESGSSKWTDCHVLSIRRILETEVWLTGWIMWMSGYWLWQDSLSVAPKLLSVVLNVCCISSCKATHVPIIQLFQHSCECVSVVRNVHVMFVNCFSPPSRSSQHSVFGSPGPSWLWWWG